MYNILFISPISIAGELIIKGFSKGFEALGHTVAIIDVRNIDVNIINNFKPDFAFGYCYAHLTSPIAEKAVQETGISVLHYFADEPFSKFAHSGNLELITQLKHSDSNIFVWDKKFKDAFGENSHYLPLAVDVEAYSMKQQDLKYDIFCRAAFDTKKAKDFG